MYERMVDDPRLSRWFPAGVPAPHPVLDAARRGLGARYGVPFGSVGLNYYRDGDDSVAWHSDKELRELDDTRIAILTLGPRRAFLIRSKQGGKSRDIKPGPGDLLVMGGRAQMDWEHNVPKRARRAIGRASPAPGVGCARQPTKRRSDRDGQSDGVGLSRATLSCARSRGVMRHARLRHVTEAGFVARQDEYLEHRDAQLDVASPLNVIAHLERQARATLFRVRSVGDPARLLRGDVRRHRQLRGHDRLHRPLPDEPLVRVRRRARAGDARHDRAALPHVQVLVHRAHARRPRRQQVVLVREPPDHLPRRRVPRRAGVPGRDVHERRPHRRGPRRAGGRARILDWLDEKARFGFTEWHSDVYYQKDVDAAAHARRVRADPEIAPARGDGARPVPVRHRAASSQRATSARPTAART